MDYLFIFVTLFLIFSFLVDESISKKLIAPYVFFVLILYFGFREGYGTDYNGYMYMVDSLRYNPDFNVLNTEVGFQFLIIILNSMGLPPYSILFLSFLITFICIYYATIRLSPSVALSIFIIVGFGFLFASLNIVRQTLSFSIIAAMLVMIKDRKYLKFSVSSAATSLLIHNTTFILAFLPLFRYINLTKIGWFLLLFLALVLSSFSLQLFNIIAGVLSVDWFPYAHYFGRNDWALTSRSNTYLNLMVQCVIVSWMITRLDVYYRNVFYKILFNAYMAGFILKLVFMDIQALVRFSAVFVWLDFIVIPIAIMSYKNKTTRALLIAALVCYAVVLIWVGTVSHINNFEIKSHLF